VSLNFIPYSPGDGGVVELSDCLSLALGQRDVLMLQNEAGDVEFRNVPDQAERDLWPEIYTLWHEALMDGALKGIVEHPETGLFRRIPRHYWLHRRPYETRLCVPGDVPTTGYDESMADRPVLIPQSDIPEWRAIVTKVRALRAIDQTEAKPAEVACTPRTKGEIKRWLIEQFASPESSNVRKPDFAAMAADKWAGKYTKRGFDSAWREATRDFPERRRAGRRAN